MKREHLVATDYDASRKSEEEIAADSLEEMHATQAAQALNPTDIDETGSDAEPVDLPGADLSGERLDIRVLPEQRDEFTCTRCFLVQHVSQQASNTMGSPTCLDCS
jgi:hypothetical protein